MASIGTYPFEIPPDTGIKFSYHMYGATMVTLKVFFGTTVVWTETGDKGNAWFSTRLI